MEGEAMKLNKQRLLYIILFVVIAIVMIWAFYPEIHRFRLYMTDHMLPYFFGRSVDSGR